MPCYTPSAGDEYDSRIKRERIRMIELREAMLCGLLTAIAKTDPALMARLKENYDAKEAGVSWGGLKRWWRKHMEKDKIRKEWAAAAHAEREKREREAREDAERVAQEKAARIKWLKTLSRKAKVRTV